MASRLAAHHPRGPWEGWDRKNRRANILGGLRAVCKARVMSKSGNPDDTKLFREAMRGVRPLGETAAAARGRRPKPAPRALFTRAERDAVLEESLRGTLEDVSVASGDVLAWRRDGVQESVVRRLRRGLYRVQAEVDLHGLTEAQAREVLREFLLHALARGYGCIRIVHGKGLRSGPRGPVLKNLVASMLRRTQAVAAFASARQVDGGTGALYVLLSRRTTA